MDENKRPISGADEKTPSYAQYFSWINNTNEGSTQEHTLINLAYFQWLKETFGMQLDIYAWDAGNLDGASGTYQALNSPKIKAQYPDGYGPVAEKAAELGMRLGVWCGPDGFGNTPEEEEARKELMVSLCRDYHFGLFKMDAVCSGLREEKQGIFIKMMQECRKYAPELILLNHRVRLGEAEPYATTFLWNGAETYTDVLIANRCTAPHHRAYMFQRGQVPGLQRLTEDHGVCLSSCLEYFEDELIYQAFGRCLILAPEIYANPWLLMDHEQARLARIYNLHRTHREILVNGMELPEEMGCYAVSRGSSARRFITTGNDTWQTRTISLSLDESIGLAPCDKVTVLSHHPTEALIGVFSYGETVPVALLPFRALLLEVADAKEASPVLSGCQYEVLHEHNGVADTVKLLQKTGEIKLFAGGKIIRTLMPEEGQFDHTERVPQWLARAEEAPLPEGDRLEQLYETFVFDQCANALEWQALQRAGATQYPAVQAARDAFFNQKTYRLRGCECSWAFDGRDDTFFDGVSRDFFHLRMKGGCLRVDFGETLEAGALVIEYFDPDEPIPYSLSKQIVAPAGDFSVDKIHWIPTYLDTLTVLYREEQEALICAKHCTELSKGSRKQAVYPINGPVRYFRLPEPMFRLYKIALVKDGKELTPAAPKANNLLPKLALRSFDRAQKATVTVPRSQWRKDAYLSVAINGRYKDEGAFAVAELDGQLHCCPDRAPSYQCNSWECPSRAFRDGNYTYYFPIAEEACDKPITLHILLEHAEDVHTEIYLCDRHGCPEGVILKI